MKRITYFLILLLLMGNTWISQTKAQTPCSNPPQCELIGTAMSGSLSQTSFLAGSTVSFTANVNSAFTDFSPIQLQNNGGCVAPNSGTSATFRLQIDNTSNSLNAWWGFFDILGDCSTNMTTNGLTGTMRYNQSFARTGATTTQAINLGASVPVGVYSVAVRLGSTTAHSQFVQIATFTVGILPPTSLSPSASSPTSINLNWTDNSPNETGFIVQRSLTSGSGFVTVGTVGANVTTYLDNTVVAGQTYFYRIVATNASESSTPSSEISAKPLDAGNMISYTNNSMGGISNALIYSGQIHYAVNHTHYELSLSGYPDVGAKGWTSQLRNESGTLITTYENSPFGADFAQSNDLQKTPSGNLAYAYRKWAGVGYGFDGFLKTWNGSVLSSESVFPTANIGLYQRLRYGTDNMPRITHFAAAGYNFIYSNKPAAVWQHFDLGALGAYAYDYASVMQGNDIYTSFGIGGNNIVLYKEVSGSWSGQLIATGTDNCDLKFSPTNNLQSLFENNFQIRLGTFSGVWSFENIVTTTERIKHRASLFYRTDNTPLIVYQTDNRLVVLEKQGASWNEIYHHTNLNYSIFVGNTRQPTLLYKGTDLYVVYADAQNVYIKKVDAINPPILTATATSSTSAKLNWTNNSLNETGFKIQRSLTSGSGFVDIGTVGANVTTFNDTGLTTNTSYFYRVIATNSYGQSNPSNEGSIVPNLDAGLVAYYPFNGNANDASGNANNGTVIGATLTTDRFCSANQAYSFNGVSDSIASPLVQSSTTKYTISFWFQTNSGGEILQSRPWSSVCCNPARSLSVNINADGKLTYGINGDAMWIGRVGNSVVNNGNWHQFTGIFDTNAGVSANGSEFSIYVDGVLDNGQTIIYNPFGLNAQAPFSGTDLTIGKMKDYVSSLHTNYSGSLDDIRIYNRALSAPEVAALYDLPVAPISLAGTPLSSFSNQITWADNNTTEDGYILQRSLSSGTGFLTVATLPANAVSFTDTGLTPNTTYFYRLSSKRACYFSTASAEISVNTLPIPPPTALSATAASPLQVNLSFTDNSSIEQGFYLERSLTAGVGFVSIATLSANTTTFADNTVSPNTVYYYRVQAFFSTALSAYSNEAFISVPALETPTALGATAINFSQINLSFTDNSSVEQGFYLERSLTPNVGFVSIATLSANTTTFADNTVSPNTVYYYRVQAFFQTVLSAYSNEANALTPIFCLKPVITNVSVQAQITCVSVQASLKISLAQPENVLYAIDLQGDNVFEYQNIAAVNQELILPNVPIGTVISNPRVRKADFSTCTSDPFSFSQTLNFTPLSPPRIALIQLSDPSNCEGTNGRVFLRLDNAQANLPHQIDLDGDQVFEHTANTNGAGEIVLQNLQAGTKIGTVGVRFGDCVSNIANQNRILRKPDIANLGLALSADPAEVGFDQASKISIEQAQTGYSYRLAFSSTVFLSDWVKAENSRLTIPSKRLDQNRPIFVWVQNPQGCEALLEKTANVKIREGIYQDQLEALKKLQAANPALSNWTLTEPYDLKGVKIENGKVTAIDLSNKNLDKIETESLNDLKDLKELNVEKNALDFEDLEKLMGRGFTVRYLNQAFYNPIPEFVTVETAQMSFTAESKGKDLIYEWYRNGQKLENSPNITGAKTHKISLKNLQTSQTGYYDCWVTSPHVPTLILQSRILFLKIQPFANALQVHWLRDFYDNFDGQNWEKQWNFNDPNLSNWYGLVLENGKIVSFSLPSNRLKGKLWDKYFEKDGLLFDLENFNLSGNSINGKLPESLKNLQKLKRLDLSDCRFENDMWEIITEMPNLETLILNNAQVKTMPDKIGRLNRLKVLLLNQNEVSTLPLELSRLADLQILGIADNYLEVLPDWFSGLKNLQTVHLQKNKIKTLPNYFVFPNLQELNLQENEIVELPDNLDESTNLKMLNISSNRLDFKDLEKILTKNNNSGNKISIIYAPQAFFGKSQEFSRPQGSNFTIQAQIVGEGNTYTWYQNGIVMRRMSPPYSGEYSMISLSKTDAGTYVLAVTNPIAPDLTLYSHETKLNVTCATQTSATVVLAGNPKFCEGEQVGRILTIANLPANSRVQWFINNNSMVGQTNSRLIVRESGTYQALITDRDGCSNFTKNKIVMEQLPAPRPQISVHETDAALLSVKNPENYATFQWFRNDQAMPNAISPTWKADQLGKYNLKVTDRNGCLGLSNSYVITPLANTQDFENEEIKIYPNPANDVLHIDLPARLSKNYQISIWNAQGKEIQKLENQHTFYVGNLPSGLYLIKIYYENSTIWRKITIEK